MRGLPGYYLCLVTLCRRWGCFSLEDARDMVQEAHLRLFTYEQSATVRDAGSLLRRIMINLNINRFHRNRSARFPFADIDRIDRMGLLIDPAAGPERTLAAEQELDGVADLLSVVSTRTCQMFIAQRGGYSYGEVASAFAVKERTVEKHVAAATTMLHEAEHQGRRPVWTMRTSMTSGVRRRRSPSQGDTGRGG
jgi:DNA-directed RNA polymerase specialized sigma24 family protein